MFIIGAGTKREFKLNDQFRPYVAAGMGVTFINADDIVGKYRDGVSFDIATDTGIKFIPYFNGGIRWMFWRTGK